MRTRLPSTLAALTPVALVLGCGEPQMPAGAGVHPPVIFGGDTIPAEVLQHLDAETRELLVTANDDTTYQAAFDEAMRQLSEPWKYFLTPEQAEALTEEERESIMDMVEQMRAYLDEAAEGDTSP